MMNYELIEKVMNEYAAARENGTVKAWRKKVWTAKQMGVLTEEEANEISARRNTILAEERREQMKEDMMKMEKALASGNNYYFDRWLHPEKYASK